MPLYPGINEGMLVTSDLPTSFTHWHDESVVVAGNALATDNYSNYPYGSLSYQNPPAVNDVFQFSKLLDAGTYNFYILGGQGVNRGIIHLNVNGVDTVGDLDFYGQTFSTLLLHIQISITKPGIQVFNLTTIGKNAGSSNYFAVLTKMWAIK